MAAAVASSSPLQSPGRGVGVGFAPCLAGEASFDFRSLARPGGAWLDEAFADHDNQLAQWRKDRMQALQQEAHRAARELGRERASLEDLSDELAATARLAEDVKALRAEGARVGQVVRENVANTAKRTEVAGQARERFLQVLQARQEELRREEQQLAEQDALTAKRVAEVERFLQLYRDRLGLALARVAPQTVRLTFTLLDQEDPKRQFGFTLGLEEGGGGYSVEDCSPALPPRRLAALVAQLHSAAAAGEAAALPAFVCGMRRAFREVAGGGCRF